MSSLIIQSETLDDIATAIRSKTGKSASMTPLEMPAEIRSISGGGGSGRQVAIGTFSHKTSATTVDIGFKPVFLCVRTGSSQSAISTYDASTSTTQAKYSGANTSTTNYTMSSTSTEYRLKAITDTGFTMVKAGSACTGHYFAIGE